MKIRLVSAFGAGIACCALILTVTLGIPLPFQHDAQAQTYGAWQTVDRVYSPDQWNRDRTADLDRWIQNMPSTCDIRTIVTDVGIMVYYRCLE